MRVFIGMETSGALRSRFSRQGHDVISCDTLPAEDSGGCGRHIVADVFHTLTDLASHGWRPDFAIFHPTCTFHTLSAAWAFKDGPYHQKVKPGTLVGAARREARELAEADVERIKALPIKRKVMENPRGTIPTRTSLGSPQQVVHPYQFGDDASKATCLWLWNTPPLPIDPAKRVAGRIVEHNGKMVERWSNQTDSGQNRLTPSDDRWKDRSRTFPGIADAMTATWGRQESYSARLDRSINAPLLL